MSQPIYVVEREKVLEVIRHQSQFTRIDVGYDWGEVESVEQLYAAINALPVRQEPNLLDMSKLAACIQSFHTDKMVGDANRMLVRIWAIIKNRRTAL